MRKLQLFILMISLCGVMPVFATQAIYPFENPQQRSQFYNLIAQLRCLVCQNESLADSNAGLAKDLRKEVYHMVLNGKNDNQIKTYLVNRYSDFVLFKPPVNRLTYLLWYGPFIFLIAAFLALLLIVRARRKLKQQQRLTPQEQQRLHNILSGDDS